MPKAAVEDMVKAAFVEAEEVPNCEHGLRKVIEGIKNNKPWKGYVCTSYADPKCPPIWLELTPAGKWKPQVKK